METRTPRSGYSAWIGWLVWKGSIRRRSIHLDSQSRDKQNCHDPKQQPEMEDCDLRIIDCTTSLNDHQPLPWTWSTDRDCKHPSTSDLGRRIIRRRLVDWFPRHLGRCAAVVEVARGAVIARVQRKTSPTPTWNAWWVTNCAISVYIVNIIFLNMLVY